MRVDERAPPMKGAVSNPQDAQDALQNTMVTVLRALPDANESEAVSAGRHRAPASIWTG
jgi:hypothetical protein